MKLQRQIEWWVPGGSIVYSGDAMTRWTWIRLTWRGYLAWWFSMGRAAYLLAKEAIKQAEAGQ